MTEPVSGTREMLAQMAPQLDQRSYCFIMVEPAIAPQALGAAIATFREDEGVTAVVPAHVARELGDESPELARITLTVHSSLTGVGLTAAVSSLLAEHAIACNVIAAYHHDHLFVPVADGERALQLLLALQAGASSA